MADGTLTSFSDQLIDIRLAAPGARDLVDRGFTSAQAYANSAFNEATTYLAGLQAAATTIGSLPAVDATLPSVAGVIGDFVAPPAPVRPDVTMNLPALPAEPALATVSPLTVPDAPAFTAQAPVLNMPTVPAALTETAPVAPELSAVVIPTAPDAPLPDVPALIGISVPTAPLLALPVFQAVLPDSPLAPAYIFSFAESTYTSTLLTTLRTRLQEWLDGQATGLPADVENAIWERARSREATASARKIIESARNFARSGFTKPPGAMSIEMSQALQESNDNLITASREVMIKQADLEQSNRRFALEQAWKVEEGLITYTGQIAGRALEAAKFAQQIGIDIYREAVAAYRASIEGYAARVEAFKAMLQGELAKLDVFKAEIEAQRLIGTINEQLVNVYRARVEAAKMVVDIFKAEVDAANAQAGVNKTIIEAFAARVGAFAEMVRAKAAEYQGYATQVQAEVSRTEVFTAQSQAFSAQVQGYKAGVEAQASAKQIELEISKYPLEVFKVRTEVFRDIVGAEGTRLDALAKVYTADAGAFDSLVKGEIGRIQGQAEQVKSETEVAVAGGNLRIEAAKANIQTLTQQVTLLVEAIKGGAQVAAQLAAAALSSVNLSAQIGDHTSYGVTSADSTNTSTSTSTSTVASNSVASSITQSKSESTAKISQDTTTDYTAHIYNYSN